MRCIVTAGPTFEPLDQVRRLTNHSTGRLGSELATFLTSVGHEVTLLLGEQATWAGEKDAARIEMFTSTDNLRLRLRALADEGWDAVFHAAAVSDFTFGKVFARTAAGDLQEVQSGKLSTRGESLFAELVPTPKIIADLRGWFPRATIVGWKYEVEGGREQVVEKASRQIFENQTDACVANGPAYGEGFGMVTTGGCDHLASREELFASLQQLAEQ